jgi:flagellar hook-associated protein 2
MGTITMSGFNNIDWSSILNDVMAEDSGPLTALQTEYSNLQTEQTNYSTLATQVQALDTAAASLADPASVSGRSGVSSDPSTVTVSAANDAMIGSYNIVVKSVACAQVSATTVASGVADPNNTTVATGGSLVIGGTTVTLTGNTTLNQLATAINDTSGVPAVATVVSTNGQYRLVLTGSTTGTAGAFTINNQLTGSSLAFGATNAVDAQDADATINNVEVTSSSNTLSNVIPNATITLLRQNTSPTTVSISDDGSAAQTALQGFITAYNSLMSAVSSQETASTNNTAGAIGDDPLVRSLQGQIASAVLQSVNVGGAFSNLADIGVEFNEDGTLSLDATTFSDAQSSNEGDIETLLAGTATTPGVFAGIQAAIDQYSEAGGLLDTQNTQLTNQMSDVNDQITAEQNRLAIEQASLQQEYSATDDSITTMNNDASSLSNLGSGYELF